MSAMRERFEAAWRASWPTDPADVHNKDYKGEYDSRIVQDTWEGFQLGYKAALGAAAKVCEDKRDDRWRRESPYEEGQCESANECAEAIRQLGSE